jgi:hypothetical protein
VAHGGDKSAALSSLNNFLVGKLQTAVKPDGTLDSAAFDKVMAPYNDALNGNGAMYFSGLRKNFADVKAAQATLDKITGQNDLNASIASPDGDGNGGGLRDMSVKGGVVTRQSMQGWLTKNADKIVATQTPATVMRWKQIANAVPNDPLAYSLGLRPVGDKQQRRLLSAPRMYAQIPGNTGKR